MSLWDQLVKIEFWRENEPHFSLNVEAESGALGTRHVREISVIEFGLRARCRPSFCTSPQNDDTDEARRDTVKFCQLYFWPF